MIAYWIAWRVAASEALATMLAALAGCMIGLLTLHVRYNPHNVVVVFHPLEILLAWASLSEPRLPNGGSLFSTAHVQYFLHAVVGMIGRRTFFLQPSPRPTIFVEWFVVAATVIAIRRREWRLVLQAAALMLTDWGIDTLGMARQLEQGYFLFSDPLAIMAAALLIAQLKDLQQHRWTYPIGIGLITITIVMSQAEPVKRLFSKVGPEVLCVQHPRFPQSRSFSILPAVTNAVALKHFPEKWSPVDLHKTERFPIPDNLEAFYTRTCYPLAADYLRFSGAVGTQFAAEPGISEQTSRRRQFVLTDQNSPWEDADGALQHAHILVDHQVRDAGAIKERLDRRNHDSIVGPYQFAQGFRSAANSHRSQRRKPSLPPMPEAYNTIPAHPIPTDLRVIAALGDSSRRRAAFQVLNPDALSPSRAHRFAHFGNRAWMRELLGQKDFPRNGRCSPRTHGRRQRRNILRYRIEL